MVSVALALFLAGILTILLPCILPLLPVVLGLSVTDRHPLRPLATITGMILSFTGFTFFLQVVLSRFAELADVIRIGTYVIILLFGFGFLTSSRVFLWFGALLGAGFFLGKGIPAVIGAAALGVIAMEVGGRIAARLQTLGTDLQGRAREGVGPSHQLLTALVVGLTLGLVWAPCAGPGLSFALTVVRDRPGPEALFLLFAYALGAGLPLLLVGYGGQWAAGSVRALTRYSGHIKRFAGVLLILCAFAFRFGWFTALQVWIADHTNIGSIGSKLEETLFDRSGSDVSSSMPSALSSMSALPRIARAPEFSGLGPWHNLSVGGQGSDPFTLASLKGKVVLVDFWTYSCINCIRTLPYLEGFWNKYKTQPFVLLGVHTPEFVFEKTEANVAHAIKQYGLTYPVAQDNDFATWNAFANRYWPAKYLIDAEGYIRYTHFGEGDYEETDKAIASLLKEIGAQAPDVPMPEETAPVRRPVSAETYLGERSWPAFAKDTAGRPAEQDDRIHHYVPSPDLALHTYTLEGDWQLVEGERQVLRSETGEIRMKFLGGEMNLVLGTQSTQSVDADILIDGKMTKSITVDHHDLFNLFKGPYGEHDMILKIRGKGLEGYAFTFGS